MSSSYQFLSGRLLARNVLWNLAGRILPLITGVVSIPILIKALGKDGFGLLSIAWIVVGYFSLFDMGIGRSLAKVVAEKLAKNEHDQVAVLAWTGQGLLLILGLMGCVVAWFATPWIVDVLNLPLRLWVEAHHTLYVLSISIPFVVSSSGFRGILAAYQRFDLINKIQVLLGTWMFLGPLLILPFSRTLSVIVAILAFGRIVALIVYLVLSWRVTHISDGLQIRASVLKPILSLGGWMTVSNIVGPVMTYMDRFFIGAWVSVTAVTYYTVPYEVVTKLSILPQAMMGVLFPALSFSLAGNRAGAARLVDRALRYLFIVIFPAVFLITVFATEILRLWVGSEVANQSTLVTQLLAIGVLINTPAHVAFSLIQAEGKANWTACVHLVELPIYLVLLWWSATHYGIIGVAFIWSARVAMDSVIMVFLMSRVLPQSMPGLKKTSLLLFVAVVVCMVPMLNIEIVNKFMFAGTIMVGFLFLIWNHLLSRYEKYKIVRCIR
ncbi:MAG TPA: flippase [Desulfobulbus sp.]|nr:flippase [Desulfobulbus sp.]